jgi:hypothetical protein
MLSFVSCTLHQAKLNDQVTGQVCSTVGRVGGWNEHRFSRGKVRGKETTSKTKMYVGA